MSGFKLIGIRTRDRISEKEEPSKSDYLKILKENTFYPFYNCFDYNPKSGALIYYPEKEIEIYASELSTLENQTSLNVSAIVGKNGSGKSTIIELLFLAIHNIASHCKILKSPDDGSPWYTELGVELDLFYQIKDTVHCISLDDFDITISSVELDKKVGEYVFKDFKEFKKSKLEEFFYSIAINYSIYSLNTEHVGDWIRALFHKNDGYQTPAVINPMRDRGNIDINREEYLSKSRLLANLLVQSKTKEHLNLTTTQKVVDLRFELNKKKIKNLYENKRLAKPIIWTFEQLYLDYSSESDLLDVIYKELIELDRSKVKVPFKEEVEKYIVKKLFKIARTYDSYKKYLDDKDGILSGQEPAVYSTGGNIQPTFYNLSKEDENADRNLNKYIHALKEDKSHITFKLNQAINYLRTDPLTENKEIVWKENILDISVDQLSTRISKTNSSDIINFIPPSLFNVDIFLEEIDSTKKRSRFGSLSSGEQQLIQSIQSIVYHINNLNSVFNNNSEDIKYRYINIILDEIELYFHPDFQRLFVSTLIENLKKSHLEKIEGINILFSTHSPFILSDIPSSNILRLKDGKPEIELPKNQTFGANIHDLLSDSFYMPHTIGELSKTKIEDIITFYEKVKKEKSNDQLTTLKKEYELLRTNFYMITDIIGEEIIKGVLHNHLSFIDKKLQFKTEKSLEEEMEFHKLKYEKIKSLLEKNNNK